MPRRLLNILPARPRAFVDRNLHVVGFGLMMLYITVIGALALNAVQSEGRERDQKLNGNRVEQTRQSCRERNEERATLRRKVAKPLAATFRAQREQTRRVPAAAFEQFQVTKQEAIGRLNEAVRGLEKAKAAFHRLDCRRRVASVRAALD